MVGYRLKLLYYIDRPNYLENWYNTYILCSYFLFSYCLRNSIKRVTSTILWSEIRKRQKLFILIQILLKKETKTNNKSQQEKGKYKQKKMN
jgi:hypothetical protein